MSDNQVVKSNETSQQLTLKGFFEKPDVKARLEKMLGKQAQSFMTSILQIVADNRQLKQADPLTVYNAACTAATMNLPINNNLGFAWIIPYKQKYRDEQGKWQEKYVAQFQMGYKGYVQLAQRTGEYTQINVIEVHENQFKKYNTLTEKLDADFEIEGNGKVVGYCAYFSLRNGFEKTEYWSYNKVLIHGGKYSKSFNDGVWKSDFNSMAKKTVLKNMLAKWGILSIEMQTAITIDQAVIKNDTGTDFEYIDNEPALLNESVDKLRERFELLINDATDPEVLNGLQAQVAGEDEKYHDLLDLIALRRKDLLEKV